VERIVGSTERHREFDRLFLPKSAGSQTRWKRIDRAFHRCEDLPPVSLYVVGAEAEDFHGRLRVWVARYHSVEWIDAEVTEFRVPHVPHGEPPNRPQSPFHTYTTGGKR
jgi:hypothetical protein